MNLKDKYDGSNDPFEGNRTLFCRGLPKDAQILNATATVIPIDASHGLDPFTEVVAFDGSGPDWGATKVIVPTTSTATPGWVEVDFHKRRTLASVDGATTTKTDSAPPASGPLVGANLEVDLGGLYVEINDKGAILSSPSDTRFQLPSDGSLPGLTVNKFKLTRLPTSSFTKFSLDVTKATIRSVPSNVSLRLAEMGPFWTHLGDLSVPDTSSDFAQILQKFLATATVGAGFYVVPLVLHSDTIARLVVKLEIEYLSQVDALPAVLSEAVFPFDSSTLAKANVNLLTAELPSNALVVPGQTTSRVIGAFEDTRIALGSIGEVKSVATADISPVISQAQFFSPSDAVSPTTTVTPKGPIVVSAVDLLLAAVTPQAQLTLEVRGDADGKPDDGSVLPRPIEFSLAANAAKQPVWVSVPLPSPFRFEAKNGKDSTQGKYWIVLQSLDGEVLWSAEPAILKAPPLQHTQDGALSWRDTSAIGISGPLAGLFRLRTQPDKFKMPIQLQVGTAGQVPPVKFDDFEPLGRVDFAVNTPNLAETINNYVQAPGPAPCREVEYLANGNFEQWMPDLQVPGDPVAVEGVRRGVGCGAVTIRPDGAVAYVAIAPPTGYAAEAEASLLLAVDAICDQVLSDPPGLPFPPGSEPVPNALIVAPDGQRLYLAIRSGSDKKQQVELHAIDGRTLQDLGHITLRDVDSMTPRPLALSPDGKWLFWVVEDRQKAILVVVVFDRASVDSLILKGTRSLPPKQELPLSKGQMPKSMAVAPDGSRLYVAVEVTDTSTVEVTYTGAVVTFDLATGQILLPIIPLPAAPMGMAITSDGSKLWVALDKPQNGRLASVDLPSGRVKTLEIGKPATVVDSFSPLGVAVTPQGTKLYVLATTGLFTIQLGSVPADWSRTLGYLTPICAPRLKNGEEQVIALLGLIPTTQTTNPVSTGLSQVAPVSGGCEVEFSFLGVSSEPGALAEVFWLQADGTLLRTDQVAITVGNPPADTRLPPGPVFASAISTGEISLVLHRLRLTAPLTASQAEVRFSVPAGVLAAVGLVSMPATAESLVNGDFEIFQNGRPADWTLSPGAATGIVLSQVGGALQLENASSDTADLSQCVSVTGGQPYVFEFEGHVVPPAAAQPTPHVEVDWFKADGTAAGPPAGLEILATGFGSYPAAWKTPDGTVQACVHLIVPPGSTLEVTRVSLRPSKSVSVPLNFIAEAPGELRVSKTKITFDLAKPQPLPVPTGGLAQPTPPDRKPGELPCGRCYCPSCQTERKISNPKPRSTPAGRPALVGSCQVCGSSLFLLGGPAVAGAPALRSFRIAAKPYVPPRGKIQVESVPPEVTIPPLTSIEGINPGRARQLALAGMTSLEDLALATPEQVVRAVKGVSPETAARFIESARGILAAISGRAPKKGSANPEEKGEEHP